MTTEEKAAVEGRKADFARHKLTVLAGHIRCRLDTDKDGNCAAHRKGCPPPPVLLRLAEPETRNNCVTLAFSADGIALFGDVNFGPFRHVVCSTPGYTIGWFRGLSSWGYIGEKFLERTWNVDRAAERVRALLAEEREEAAEPIGIGDTNSDVIEGLVDLLAALETSEASQEDLVRGLSDLGYPDDADAGMCYDARAVSTLAAIAARFDECLTEMGI